MPTVGPNCATHLLSCLEQASLDIVPDILSGSISYTCRHTHMQVKDFLEMIVCLRVFKLLNFKRRGELALGFWFHISPHVDYKKLMLQGYLIARDHFYICDKLVVLLKRMKSICVAAFPDLYVMRWLSRFLKRVPKKQVKCWIIRVLSPSTSGSGLQ